MIIGSMPILGVALALLSAAVLTVGNLWQARGVTEAGNRRDGYSGGRALIRTPIWWAGTACFGLSIVLQMGSLAFAPLIVVQPIGVAALVFSVLLSARIAGTRPSRAVVRAMVITLVGVTCYVIVAASVSTQTPITDGQLVAMIVTLAAVLVVSLVVRVTGRNLSKIPFVYVVIGAVYSGFVATLGKTVLIRVEAMLGRQHLDFDSGDVLTIACIAGIGIASVLSIYFIQQAHTCNPPDVVIAGLTVVDPAVAVILGITILQEAASAPWWSIPAFIVSGAVAFSGVLTIARAEQRQSDDLPAAVGKAR